MKEQKPWITDTKMQRVNEIVSLRGQGYTLGRIGKVFGMSRQAIHYQIESAEKALTYEEWYDKRYPGRRGICRVCLETDVLDDGLCTKCINYK